MRGTWQTTDSSGGFGRAVAVAVVVVFAAAAAGPVGRAVGEALRIAVIVIASVAGLAVAAVLALVAVRIRRRIRSAPRAVPCRVAVLDGRRAPALPGRGPRALPASRGDVSALPREHADTHVVTSRSVRPRCSRRAGRW